MGSPKKVVMFSTSWCTYCKKAKAYFKKNGIRFTEYDVEKSRKGQKLYAQMGAKSVPVIMVGDQHMSGFSESGFQRLYK